MHCKQNTNHSISALMQDVIQRTQKKHKQEKKCRKKNMKKEKKKKLPSLQSKNCERKMYDEKLPLTITFERKQWLEYLHYARISISLKFCNVLSLVLMLMIRDNGVFFLSVLRL